MLVVNNCSIINSFYKFKENSKKMDANLIKQIISSYIDNAKVNIIDTNGTGDHFNILVISDVFNNMTLIKRHKLIHQCLKKYINNEIHAIQLKTLTTREYEKK